MKSFLRSLSLLAAVAGLTSCINVGQAVVTHRVYGTVIDAATHRPVPHAHVALQDDPKTAATTAPDGAFDIPSRRAFRVQLPGAQHHVGPPAIVVTAPGYRPATVTAFNHRHEIALTRN